MCISAVNASQKPCSVDGRMASGCRGASASVPKRSHHNCESAGPGRTPCERACRQLARFHQIEKRKKKQRLVRRLPSACVATRRGIQSRQFGKPGSGKLFDVHLAGVNSTAIPVRYWSRENGFPVRSSASSFVAVKSVLQYCAAAFRRGRPLFARAANTGNVRKCGYRPQSWLLPLQSHPSCVGTAPPSGECWRISTRAEWKAQTRKQRVWRRSRVHSRMKCRSVFWERAVSARAHLSMHWSERFSSPRAASGP